MEKEVQTVWDYYLEKFNKDWEIISPSAKRMGISILSELSVRFPQATTEHRVGAMTAAVDVAQRLVRAQPKKSYFANWYSGKLKSRLSQIETLYPSSEKPPPNPNSPTPNKARLFCNRQWIRRNKVGFNT